jgi:hypothetical protein
MLLIERDALTSVLERPPCTGNGDELIDVSCGKDGDSPCIFIGKKGDSPFLRKECTSFDDDTVSTASLSDSSYEDDKRVSFADTLVSDVWERPRTPPEEVSKLFFSSEETQRFRQEYRLERKLLAELDVDPETHPVDEEELSALFATSSSQGSTDRHRISRVVVLHNDKLETYLNPEQVSKGAQDDGFFDNESFWSGSITWF